MSQVMKKQLLQDWMAGRPISWPMAPRDPAILAADLTDRAAAPLHEAILHAQSAADLENLVLPLCHRRDPARWRWQIFCH
jgi:hypothetical protein